MEPRDCGSAFPPRFGRFGAARANSFWVARGSSSFWLLAGRKAGGAQPEELLEVRLKVREGGGGLCELSLSSLDDRLQLGDFVVARPEHHLKLVQERAALLAFPLQLGYAGGMRVQLCMKRFELIRLEPGCRIEALEQLDQALLQVAELGHGERKAPLGTP